MCVCEGNNGVGLLQYLGIFWESGWKQLKCDFVHTDKGFFILLPGLYSVLSLVRSPFRPSASKAHASRVCVCVFLCFLLSEDQIRGFYL